jgi:hypothetical protein
MSKLTTTAIRALGLAAATAALIPAGASAATTWFGSSLNHEPANAGNTCADFNLNSQLCTHVGSYYPGMSGRARSSATGTINAVRVDAAGPMTFTLEVVRVHNMSSDFTSGDAKVVQRSRLLHANGPSQTDMDNGVYPIESFHVHLHVRKGQELAIETDSNQAEYCSDGTPGQLLFSPTLQLGNPFAPSNSVDDCLMLVQAIVRH